jgi:hypothetical protein
MSRLAPAGRWPALGIPWTVFGLLLVIFGPDREARLVGLVSVLFVGGAGLTIELMRPSARGLASPRHVEVGHERGRLFALGRARQAAMLFGQLAVVAGCGVLALLGHFIGVIAAVVFGAFAVIPTARGLLRPRGLALTPTRIVTVGFGQGEVAWDDVEAVGTVQQGPALLLGIEATDVRGLSAFGRLTRRWLPTDIAVPADDTEALVRTLVEFLDQPERRPELAQPA